MGMLDGLFDDPIAQISLGLLGGQHPNFGQNLMQAVMFQKQMQEQAEKRKLQQMQLEGSQMDLEAKRRQAMQQQKMDALGPQFMRPGVSNLTPNDDNGFPMPTSPGGMDWNGYAGALTGIDPMKGLAMQSQLSQMGAKERVKVDPGQTIGSYVNGQFKPDYAAPDKPPAGFTRDAAGKLVVEPGWLQAQQEIRKAGKPEVTTNTHIIPPKKTFEESLRLKKDFDDQPEVKAFKEVRHAHDQIGTALKSPSPANDLAAATKFMKMLDPGSVVRESELMMAMQASGALDRMMNTADRILKGHKLTPAQRKDFAASSEALFAAAEGRYNATREQYQGIAGKYGLDVDFMGNSRNGEWSMQRVK